MNQSEPYFFKVNNILNSTNLEDKIVRSADDLSLKAYLQAILYAGADADISTRESHLGIVPPSGKRSCLSDSNLLQWLGLVVHFLNFLGSEVNQAIHAVNTGHTSRDCRTLSDDKHTYRCTECS